MIDELKDVVLVGRKKPSLVEAVALNAFLKEYPASRLCVAKNGAFFVTLYIPEENDLKAFTFSKLMKDHKTRQLLPIEIGHVTYYMTDSSDTNILDLTSNNSADILKGLNIANLYAAIYVEKLEVNEMFQNLGIGRTLLKVIQDEARELNIREITLSSQSDCVRARDANGKRLPYKVDKNFEFYMSEGFTPSRQSESAVRACVNSGVWCCISMVKKISPQLKPAAKVPGRAFFLFPREKEFVIKRISEIIENPENNLSTKDKMVEMFNKTFRR